MNSTTNFRDKVLQIVRAIPKGQTMSYGDVAALAGSPAAARAVGTIMKNNYDPTVPCHRVIQASGKLGQYNRGGEIKKRALLLSEGVHI